MSYSHEWGSKNPESHKISPKHSTEFLLNIINPFPLFSGKKIIKLFVEVLNVSIIQ